MENTSKTFAASLRKIRAERGLTQESLANILELEPQTIRNWEAGRRFPSPEHIDSLCQALETSSRRLFSGHTSDDRRETTPLEALEILRKVIEERESSASLGGLKRDLLKAASGLGDEDIRHLIDYALSLKK